jgi:hypothetical protein
VRRRVISGDHFFANRLIALAVRSEPGGWHALDITVAEQRPQHGAQRPF